MNSVEERVRTALSAAADVAGQEIRFAPPLRLPSAPAAGRRRRWAGWAVPLTAAAAAAALAVSLVAVKDARDGSAAPAKPAASTRSDRVPAYYVADAQGGIVAGNSDTGQILAKLAPPAPRKGYTTSFGHITAADDDRTFVVLDLTYLTADRTLPPGKQKAPVTASWYKVQLTPGSTGPVHLSRLPIAPETTSGATLGEFFLGAALSHSGQELAVTRLTASGGLAVQDFSMATGQLLHVWSTSDPSLSWPDKSSGLASAPSLTWIDGDRTLALETTSEVPGTSQSWDSIRLNDIVRELSVAGPASGDLLADSKVVWSEQTREQPTTQLETCVAPSHAVGEFHLVSADGTTFGCLAVTGPGKNPDLYFLTYPLTTGSTVARRAKVQYEVANMGKKNVSTDQVMWISPSGHALIGAWTIYAKGTLEDSPTGLHIGVLRNGKITPLKFPKGFDRLATVSSITW